MQNICNCCHHVALGIAVAFFSFHFHLPRGDRNMKLLSIVQARSNAYRYTLQDSCQMSFTKSCPLLWSQFVVLSVRHRIHYFPQTTRIDDTNLAAFLTLEAIGQQSGRKSYAIRCLLSAYAFKDFVSPSFVAWFHWSVIGTAIKIEKIKVLLNEFWQISALFSSFQSFPE